MQCKIINLSNNLHEANEEVQQKIIIINLISRVENGNEVLKSGTFGGALFASNGKFLLRRVDAAPTDGGETLQKWEAMILALPGSLLFVLL